VSLAHNSGIYSFLAISGTIPCQHNLATHVNFLDEYSQNISRYWELVYTDFVVSQLQMIRVPDRQEQRSGESRSGVQSDYCELGPLSEHFLRGEFAEDKSPGSSPSMRSVI